MFNLQVLMRTRRANELFVLIEAKSSTVISKKNQGVRDMPWRNQALEIAKHIRAEDPGMHKLSVASEIANRWNSDQQPCPSTPKPGSSRMGGNG
jgi:hypothetical protein